MTDAASLPFCNTDNDLRNAFLELFTNLAAAVVAIGRACIRIRVWIKLRLIIQMHASFSVIISIAINLYSYRL